MKREWRLGLMAGLDVTATPGALWGVLLIWLPAAWFSGQFLGRPVGLALLDGLTIAAIHFISEFYHQVGHAIFARRTGHPMAGVRFGTYWLFAASIYPHDEPMLPPRAHVFRALGGPLMSIAIGLLAAVALLLVETGGIGRLLLQFILFDNLLLLGLGAFVPLGFTDGSTILHHWRNS